MKLIIPDRIAEIVEPHFAAVAPDCVVIHVDQQGAADGDLADAEALLRWWIPAETLHRILIAAPRLRWIHTPSAGVDRVITPEMIERDIQLTNSAGAHSIPIAEFVLLFMLGHVKQARALAVLAPGSAWERGRSLHLNELYGKTLLIVGIGQI